MTTNANTPEKPTTGDNCSFCGNERTPNIGTENYYRFNCGTWSDCCNENDRTPLCRALEAKKKAEQRIFDSDLDKADRFNDTDLSHGDLIAAFSDLLLDWSDDEDSVCSGSILSKIESILKSATVQSKAEAELAEVKEQLEINSMTETCKVCDQSISTSLVEGGWCIFCILKSEKTQNAKLRGLLDRVINLPLTKFSFSFIEQIRKEYEELCPIYKYIN